MAVVTLQTPIGTSNPEARKRMVREAGCKLDERLAILKCAADSAACLETEEELAATLYWLHGEMKRQLDTIFALT